ncbi:MAG: NADH-dependent phenylglyoxylate dehydrogenase subunit alpha [Firmicutes bacterium ADurb.Bin506]|jgi:2-oxoglutarate ferredoxin oxidoreductase subunit alpha|nr:MAG: NADH-dependent phenylglyoxylate dehydrogenase subunit alpha [Firmicutes bacterium ADurb.Bin506]
MAGRKLFKGNEAVAEAAVRAGCRYFFGYPITPQNEIPEYMSRRLPEVGGAFVQAESEVAAINMVYGAAGTGARVMTSSSSPGISLKQEGISYIAGADLPCLIVNMVRGGPGLGGIAPAQSDYFQATRGGGHGDYHLIVYAPASVQEMVDLTLGAYDVAERYRMPVMILGDGVLGQMMEPVSFPDQMAPDRPAPEWATRGARDGRTPRLINSIYLKPEELYKHNLDMAERFEKASANEVRYEEVLADDAELLLVAYGTTSRVCRAAIEKLRERGIKAGLFRPITVSPFPYDALSKRAKSAKAVLTVEMSMGQLVDDVKIAVAGAAPVHFFGTTGGVIPKASDIAEYAAGIVGEEVR